MKILHYCAILLCIVALGGCGKGNANTPAAIDPNTNKHVTPGWAVPNATTGVPPHASAVDGYFALPNSCKECHGEDLAGGISKLSCYNCHSRPFPHGDGFAAFNASNVSPHATAAKGAVGVKAGMAYCAKCHGSEYNSANAKSCIACHKLANPTITTNAPHAANWATYLRNSRNLNHSTVDPSNATACAHCHAKKANMSDTGKSRVAGFITPGPGGCFDNSLCHNQAGHTFKVFDTPQEPGHMIPARSNLLFCQSCHAQADPATGSNPRFNKVLGTGVLSSAGCEGCHTQTGIAHPYMWLPGRGSHPGTNHANAQNLLAACGLCHGGNGLAGGPGYAPAWLPGTNTGIAPSCFSGTGLLMNGTRCHFSAPVNPVSGALLLCASCHGNPPDGAAFPNTNGRHQAHFTNISTASSVSALDCSVCHSGFGTGTVNHSTATAAPTAIDPKYNENGLTATYTPATQRCTNVSCHGGKTQSIGVTWPLWGTAVAFDSATCTNCHTSQAPPGALPASYTGPYIGPFSGNVPNPGSLILYGNNLHTAHLQVIVGAPSADCLKCHETPGASHFSYITLGRRALSPGFVKDTTIKGTAISSYSFNGTTSSCITKGATLGITCHDGRIESWY